MSYSAVRLLCVSLLGVAADVMEVGVDLNVDNPISYFSTVRTITFDVAQGARPGEYQMHVAFDKKVPGAG